MTTVTLKPMNKQQLSFGIVGTTSLIQHAWSEKAIRQMAEKQAGKKTKNRQARNPKKEYKDAMHLTKQGKHAIPGMAFKNAMIFAAHKDIGIEKTLLRKAMYLICDDEGLLPITATKPALREDMVRVGMGSADIRYRPEFKKWKVKITMIIDADLLQVEDVLNLVDRAGFGSGIGEMRPQKGGDYGRFKLDSSVKVICKEATDV
jgi:hypothetical protein